MPEFDVVVLGAGTSGLLIATQVARSGRSVAVVEAGLVGGESPYLACLPSKHMLRAAGRGQTWEQAVARRRELAAGLDDSAAAAALAACGVTLLRGVGRVTAPGVVEVIPVEEGAPRRSGADCRLAADPGTDDDPAAAGEPRAPGEPHAAGEPPAPRPAAPSTAPEPAAQSPAPEPAAESTAPGRPPAAVRPTAVLGYRHLVIATGSEPIAPLIEGLPDVATWTSAEALSSPHLPRRLIVLGAGRVGCELAQIYAGFGSQVTLVEAEPRVLPDEPAFVGQILGDALRETGADLRLGSAAVKAEALDSGLALILADGTRLEADRILLAAGRRPRSSGLGLDILGVVPAACGALPLDPRCRVVTDRDSGQWPLPAEGAGLWAAGDVTGIGLHAHVARYQASIVAANILGERRAADYTGVPRVVHTHPSVCCIGYAPAGSAESTQAGVRVGGSDLSTTARAAVDGEECGRVELYAVGDALVGAAAIGPRAEEWMSEVALAVRARLTPAVLADVVRPHPAYGEAIERALRELTDGKPGEDRV